jgi:hypothetical protein
MEMDPSELTRYQLLAAEIYSYSYANYLDHLGIGNIRFDRLMPNDARKLESAVNEEWPVDRVANELEIDHEMAVRFMDATRDALEVVDAKDPSESFRRSVRQVIKAAVEEGLEDDDAVEKLVVQVCYRVSDLAYLLKAEGNSLSRYCRHLRRDPNVEYEDDYFDEEEE